MGEIVDDLVQRGYAKRVPAPDDRRAKLIWLTERGEGRPGPRPLEEMAAAEEHFAAPELAHAAPA